MAYRGGGKPGNKNAEKWPEERALEFGQELIKWLSIEPIIKTSMHGEYITSINLFIIEFLALKGHSKELTSNLAEKFESFNDLLKKAKAIQESKILKYSMMNKINPTISIFCLKNHHNYKDKQDINVSKVEEAKKFKFGW